MPLYTGFRSTNVWKAFILNAFATASAVSIALLIKNRFDKYIDKDGHEVKNINIQRSLLITFFITFIGSFIVYALMYSVLSFGGGMLVNDA